jgi:uncharacterized protein (TIGR00288 family)
MNIAFLIDSENCLDNSMDKKKLYDSIKERGNIIIKRIYGDWRNSSLNNCWEDFAYKYGFDEIQVKKTSGKNSVDNKLIVDSMELLFMNNMINCFVILGADKDYYSLTSKILEKGLKVILIGDINSTSTYIIAKCSEFVNIISFKKLEPIIELFSGNTVMLLNTLKKKLNYKGDFTKYISENFVNKLEIYEDKGKMKVKIL